MSAKPTPLEEHPSVEVPQTFGPGAPLGQPAPHRGASYGKVQRWRPWLLLAPALIVLGGLLIYPLIRVASLSLQEFGLRQLVTGETVWIGFDNFTELFNDDLLWQTVLPNTVVFAVVCVVLTVALGTAVALLLFRLGPWTRGIVTSAIMAAWAVPAVTGTYVWVYLFDARSGPIMRALGALGWIDPETTNWFTDRLSFYAIATLNVVHHGFPFVAVTVLAGLMTVPNDIIEAATIDGANAWRRFWWITVPTLKPVFAVVTILSTIWDFKVFTQIYLMPGGNGTNREVLNLGVWSYVTSFAQNRFGLGSAIAVMLTLLLLAITMVYLRVMFRQEEI